MLIYKSEFPLKNNDDVSDSGLRPYGQEENTILNYNTRRFFLIVTRSTKFAHIFGF